MKTSRLMAGIGGFVVLMALLVSASAAQVTELKSFPMSTLDGLISRDGVEVDQKISSDGNGSVKIVAGEPRVVRLFEVHGIDVEDARLIYQARLRTDGVKGKVFLEMWCNFPGMGEFFSKGLNATLTGTSEWTTVQTPFFLQKDQKPDFIKLNVVVDGTGTVWVDDVKLLKGPPK